MFGYARALKTSAGRRAMAMVTFMLNRRVVVFAGLERQRRDGGDEMGNLKDERVCFYRDRGAITTRGRLTFFRVFLCRSSKHSILYSR